LVSPFWPVNGTHSCLDVPKRRTYNTAFIIDADMPSWIENVRSRTREKTLQSWSIHMDNVHPHNSKRAQRCIEASRTERLPHPPQNQAWPQVTSSSLDISKGNYLIAIVAARRTC
jgi:hypothetical protein